MHAETQQCVEDLEELLRTCSDAASANSSQDQLMLTCSAVEVAYLGIDVALDLSKRVEALEGDKALLVLRELSLQCESKLYRLCVNVPMSAKEVAHGSLARLKKDQRLHPPLLQHYLDKWTGMEHGLAALKDMGGLAIAQPRQGASPSRDKLVSLVEQHAGPLVKSDIMEVIEVLVDAAEQLKEPLFVATM